MNVLEFSARLLKDAQKITWNIKDDFVKVMIKRSFWDLIWNKPSIL